MENIIESVMGFSSQLGHVLLTIEEVIFFAGVVLGALTMCLLVWAVCTVIDNVPIFQ